MNTRKFGVLFFSCGLFGTCLLLGHDTPSGEAKKFVGGKVAGCVQHGQISIVTLDELPSGKVTSARAAYKVYRSKLDGQEPPEIVVMYKNDDQLKIGFFYTSGVRDSETKKMVGVATVQGVETLRGFEFQHLIPSSTLSLLGQEFGHHWVASNIPDRALAEFGITSGGGSDKGVLVDTTKDFTKTVWPGDTVRYDNRKSKVLSVSPHQLTTDFRNQMTAGTSYTVETDDLEGRGSAHWHRDVDMDASYMDGNDWTEKDAGFFVRVGNDSRFSDYDLHMMGLKSIDELKPLFVIKDKGFERGFVTGRKRVLTPENVFRRSPSFQKAWQRNSESLPRNYRIRFIVVTTLNHPVETSLLESLDRVRRDWGTIFHVQTEKRGSLTSTIDESLPDLVVADIESPEQMELGKPATFSVRLHNQSAVAVQEPFSLAVDIGAGPSRSTKQVQIDSMGAHELRDVEFQHTPEDPGELFDASRYRATFPLHVTVDSNRDIDEADEEHNARHLNVPWTPSMGVVTPIRGRALFNPTVDPVMDVSTLYCARQGEPPSGTVRIEAFSFADPARPTSHGNLELGERPTKLAAGDGVLAVGYLKRIELYDTPLETGSSPKRTLEARSLIGLAIQADHLFVGDGLGSFDVYKGLSGEGDLVKTSVKLPGLSIAGAFTFVGSRLFVQDSSAAVHQYEVGEDLHKPRLVRKLFDRTTVSGTAIRGRTMYAVSRGVGLMALDLDTGKLLTRDGDQVTELAPHRLMSIRKSSARSAARPSADMDDLRFVIDDEGHEHEQDDEPVAAAVPFNFSPVGLRGPLVHCAGYLLASGSTRQIHVFEVTKRLPVEVGRISLRDIDLGTTRPSLFEADGWVTLVGDRAFRTMSPTGTTREFVRGDANFDGKVDIQDPVRIYNALFGGAGFNGRKDAFDVNDDGDVNVADTIFLLSFLQEQEEEPPPPYPNPGRDPTPDTLGFLAPRR